MAAFRNVYMEYLMKALPAVGAAIGGVGLTALIGQLVPGA